MTTVTTVTTEELDFQSLFLELSAQRERIFSLARARRFLRYVGAGSLIWFAGWFIFLLGGNDRFPNLLPLALPAGLSLLAMIIHFFVGRDLAKSAPLFRAILQDQTADPVSGRARVDEDSAMGRIRLTLETDRTFGMLRREGINLEQWSSDDEELEGLNLYHAWLRAGAANSQVSAS